MGLAHRTRLARDQTAAAWAAGRRRKMLAKGAIVVDTSLLAKDSCREE